MKFQKIQEQFLLSKSEIDKIPAKIKFYMNFKKLYKRFYTVRLSLFIITFLITVALLIMSVKFLVGSKLN